MTAADEALHDAIAARLRIMRPDEVKPITHYIVVAATLDDALEDQTGYWLMFSNGSMPVWQAVGLLRVADHMLLEGDAEGES